MLLALITHGSHRLKRFKDKTCGKGKTNLRLKVTLQVLENPLWSRCVMCSCEITATTSATTYAFTRSPLQLKANEGLRSNSKEARAFRKFVDQKISFFIKYTFEFYGVGEGGQIGLSV